MVDDSFSNKLKMWLGFVKITYYEADWLEQTKLVNYHIGPAVLLSHKRPLPTAITLDMVRYQNWSESYLFPGVV